MDSGFMDSVSIAITTFLDIRRQSMTEPDRRRPDLLPVIVLLAILGAVGAGLWLFPYVQAVIQRQDCIAVGRVDCG